MAANINADTSGGLKLESDTSGVLDIQSAGTTIATVNSTGLAMAAGKTLPASALTGTLPALDASALTNLPAGASLSTASGSAPSYSARTFVSFNGSSTGTIYASGNVSSVTDRGVGLYTVNLTTAMPAANYAVVGSCGDASEAQTRGCMGRQLTDTTVRVTSHVPSATRSDADYVGIALFSV